MTYDIRHNEDDSRFETEVDGAVAFVEYDREGKDTIVFTHTIVPDELSGKGVGSQLAKHVLDYARDNHLTVVPQCAFINSWMKRHPEYEDLRRK